MRKILPLFIIVLFVYSTCFSMPVLAQNAEIIQNAEYIADYSKLSMEQKMVIVEKAFDDYLSGKTDRMIVPGAKQGNCPIIDAKAKINFTYKPDIQKKSIEKDCIDNLIIDTIVPGEPLNNDSWPSTDEWPCTAVYVGAGGSAAYPQYQNKVASSVDGVVNPSALQNMQDMELFAMHLWGTGSAGENDIVFWKDPNNASKVYVSWYLGGLNNSQGNGILDCYDKTLVLSKDHVYSIYVKARNPSGIYYNEVEFCLFDLTDYSFYIDQYTLTSTASMDRADMALEQFYIGTSPPGLTMQWRYVTNFHIYDQNLTRMNLLQSGYVHEYTISGVDNAYYHDYSYYFEPNAQATYYLTRYTGSTYPSHP